MAGKQLITSTLVSLIELLFQALLLFFSAILNLGLIAANFLGKTTAYGSSLNKRIQ